MSDASAEDVVNDNKRKMMEALKAKQQRHGEDHIDSGSQQQHAHGKVDAKRTFRRKTG